MIDHGSQYILSYYDLIAVLDNGDLREGFGIKSLDRKIGVSAADMNLESLISLDINCLLGKSLNDLAEELGICNNGSALDDIRINICFDTCLEVITRKLDASRTGLYKDSREWKRWNWI